MSKTPPRHPLETSLASPGISPARAGASAWRRLGRALFAPRGRMLPVALAMGMGLGAAPAGHAAAAAPKYVIYGHTGEIQKVDPDQFKFLRSAPKTVVKSGTITWNLVYADDVLANGKGFNGPNGAQAKSTVAAVLNYVGSTLAYANYTATVEINIEASEIDGGGYLAKAGSYYTTFGAGFNYGDVESHIVTGVDPDPGFADGAATFDFGFTWNFGTGAPTASQFDFYSTALHEFTHALGFISLTDSNGASRIGFADARGIYDKYMETGNGFDLFADAGAGQFLGTTSNLLGSDGGLVLDHPQLTAVYGTKPPIYAPSSFAGGSSLSHWADSVSGAVMLRGIFPGVMHRSYLPVEQKAFIMLGYGTGTPTPSPTPVITSSPTPSPSPTPLPVNIGNNRDAPTWQVGDRWQMRRTMNLALNIADMIPGLETLLPRPVANLALLENYDLAVADINDRTTTNSLGASGTALTYVRARENASLISYGELLSTASAAPFPLDLGIGAVEGPGEAWSRVSDLADSHETFSLSGTLTAHGNGLFAPTTATAALVDIGATITLEFEAPLEWADFPLDYTGEAWLARPRIRIRGEMSLDFPPVIDVFAGSGGGMAPAPPDRLVTFDSTLPEQFFRFTYASDGPRQGFNPSARLAGERGEEAYYSRDAKEFVEKNLPVTLPILVDAGTTPTLLGALSYIVTKVQPGGATLLPGPNLTQLAFTPLRAVPSGSVLLTGKLDGRTTYTATLLVTDQTISGSANGSGVFSASFTAPASDDDTPASADGGSHGLRIETATGVKVITLQLQGAGLSPSVNWAQYE